MLLYSEFGTSRVKCQRPLSAEKEAHVDASGMGCLGNAYVPPSSDRCPPPRGKPHLFERPTPPKQLCPYSTIAWVESGVRISGLGGELGGT